MPLFTPHSSHNGTATQSCPRCHSEIYNTLFQVDDRLYHVTDHRFFLVECRGCGLIRLHPGRTPEALDQFYPHGFWWQSDESSRGRLAEAYRKWVIQDHARFVAGGLPEPSALLDIGCGPGTFLAAMREKGHIVYGMDSAVDAAQVAWREYRIPVVTGMLPQHPFADVGFGGVTLFHVLEHLPNPEACLRAVFDILAPGGKLFVQVPNAACWQFLLFGERWNGLQIPRHLIHFRPEDLRDLLGACGFEVRREKHFSLRDNPAGLATTIAPDLEPVSRRVHGKDESLAGKLSRDAAYLALTVAALPFTLLEAAGGAGSTIMVEAVRKGEG